MDSADMERWRRLKECHKLLGDFNLTRDIHPFKGCPEVASFFAYEQQWFNEGVLERMLKRHSRRPRQEQSRDRHGLVAL